MPTAVATRAKYGVTLRHPRTEDEAYLEVEASSSDFMVVLRAIQSARAAAGLRGYEISDDILLLEGGDQF